MWSCVIQCDVYVPSPAFGELSKVLPFRLVSSVFFWSPISIGCGMSLPPVATETVAGVRTRACSRVCELLCARAYAGGTGVVD